MNKVFQSMEPTYPLFSNYVTNKLNESFNQ